MEENYQTLLRMKENQLIKAFEKNQMSCMIVKDENELKQYLRTVLKDQKKVAVGGSVTLSQLGIIDLIRESDVQFIDRYEMGLSQEQVKERLREGLLADIFITGTNALTMDGCLYNIDGTGNRVAAMIFGPKDVYVIAGINKICAKPYASSSDESWASRSAMARLSIIWEMSPSMKLSKEYSVSPILWSVTRFCGKL